MDYVTLTNNVGSGEVWAPGPLHNTVWILDSEALHGARVVSASPKCIETHCIRNRPDDYDKRDHYEKHDNTHRTGLKEIEYEVPEPPRDWLQPRALERAYEIKHRHWRASVILGRDWYNRRYIAKERDYSVIPPTQAELDAANHLIGWHNHNQKVGKIYYEGHHASRPLSDKRFVDMWKGDSNDDQPLRLQSA